MFTAPWHLLSKQSNFYNDLSLDEATNVLRKYQNHSYLWTDFDGLDIKLIVRDDPNIIERNFNIIPLNITDNNFALDMTLFKLSSCRVLGSCGLARICRFEAKLRSPRSLLDLSRQSISQHFDFYQLIDAHLPSTLYAYLFTTLPTPSHCIIACDQCLTSLMM